MSNSVPCEGLATLQTPKNHDGAFARFRADLTLLVVAIIWGSAFVAQRTGNEQVGPFTFNAVRFLVGSMVLLPILIWQRFRSKQTSALPSTSPQKSNLWRSGLLLGLLLFGGASLQQLGLVTTTAGKGGFITGLYVVIVPLLLVLFWRDRIRWGNWVGAALAVVGLFLLSISLREAFRIDPGDVWVLLGAFMWAMHVIAVGQLVPGQDPLKLAATQYTVCALLCAAAALVLEWGTWDGVLKATPSILYAGVFSTGLAYTGQVVAQRHAPAADAAIILSMESVFAVLSGWLALGETLTGQQLVGCALMFAGMLLAQLPSFIPANWRK
ncbi:MAG: DMT family transporter [Anaerolineae bacterium]|nr:DMT family transporter [Anaerolineae bacterium]